MSVVETEVRESGVEKFSLPNGLRLLVKENHRLPFVEFRAVFQGGVLAETPANNGITQLMGKLLLKGTTERSAEQIASEIESVGGHLDSYGGNNSFGVNAEVMSGDFNVGLELLADVLLNPAFAPEALEREREVQLAGIREQRDNLVRSASIAMRRVLFGGVGYGLDSLGTENSVKQLSTAAVQAFHRQFTVPNNCVLAIYGDVQTAAVRAAVEKAFVHWKPLPETTLARNHQAAASAARRVAETRDKKQAVLVIGYPGTTLFSAERYALELLQEACSDLGSRLFLRVREQLGLAYYVGAQSMAGLAPGYFAFYCGTAPEKASQVESELLREAELLCRDGLTAEELNRAKAKLLGQRKIARQELGNFAAHNALDELYGLGFDYYTKEDAALEAVTLADVLAVARKHLQPDRAVVSLVAPPV
jgi:zinc protease